MSDLSKMPLRQLLARRLRRLRVARGWSQEVLAELSGLHRTYISDIEQGQRNIGLDNVERLARILDIPVSELLKEEDVTGRYVPRIEEDGGVYGQDEVFFRVAGHMIWHDHGTIGRPCTAGTMAPHEAGPRHPYVSTPHQTLKINAEGS